MQALTLRSQASLGAEGGLYTPLQRTLNVVRAHIYWLQMDLGHKCPPGTPLRAPAKQAVITRQSLARHPVGSGHALRHKEAGVSQPAFDISQAVRD